MVLSVLIEIVGGDGGATVMVLLVEPVAVAPPSSVTVRFTM